MFSHKQGTNQYCVKPKYRFWGSLWLIVLFLALVAFLSYYMRPQPMVSPLPQGFMPERLLVVYAKYEGDPVSYINEIFQNDAPKALQLLKCENPRLNPYAVHLNKDGSRDFGIFQINDKWQGVQPKFLLNYKINTQIAYQLYKENHNSFALWACNK